MNHHALKSSIKSCLESRAEARAELGKEGHHLTRCDIGIAKQPVHLMWQLIDQARMAKFSLIMCSTLGRQGWVDDGSGGLVVVGDGTSGVWEAVQAT